MAALLHDIGEAVTPNGHGEIAAAMLRPYVRPSTHWMLEHHELFQSYYYGDDASAIKNLRDRFKDCDHFTFTEIFCRDYDQMAFDPDYETLPESFFYDMVVSVFSRPPYQHWDQPSSSMVDAKRALSCAYPDSSN